MSSDAVQSIKERLSILEVVAPYVELHKAGKHYKGKSPFTTEKTPSFFVSPDRGMYYCFSTQKGGDIFTFVEEMEGVDFKGALKILAEKAGVELTPEDPKKRNVRETQYALLEEAAAYFFRNREGSDTVTEYVKNRGVTGETMYKWRIGYALPEWRSLRNYLLEKKFTDEQMLSAGLIKKAEGGKEPYDVFRDRVMFPIADASGRVVAFSGRALVADEGVPKYVNSPETEFFQKSEILYGYDKAKQGIRHFDFSLIVEGQFDVVLAHQAGYTNTVAVSGTALTDHHVMLLERLSSKVVLALDSDRAGVAAVKRSSERMLERGMDVKVAGLPEGKDPADMIKENPAEFKKHVGKSKHVVTFLLSLLLASAKDERSYKLRVREEVLPLLLRIPSRIDREHFEGEIAEAVHTTKDAIHYEIERLSDERSVEFLSDETVHPDTTARKSRKEELKEYLLALTYVLKDEHVALKEAMLENLKMLLPHEEYEALMSLKPEQLSASIFLAEQYIEEAHTREVAPTVSHHLTELSKYVARERLQALKSKIREAEEEHDSALLDTYLEETKEVQCLLEKDIVLTGNEASK